MKGLSSSTNHRTIIGSMAVGGFLSGAANYFISIRAFSLAIYLAAPIVFVVALGITYAVLHHAGQIRLEVNAWRVALVSVVVVFAYFLVETLFESVSAACDHGLHGNWASIGAFLALTFAGMVCAGMAWAATITLTKRLDTSVLLRFMLMSLMSAIASSLASAVAVRNMNAAHAVVLLLFPGVLFTVGMTLFAAVFGYALARTNYRPRRGNGDVRHHSAILKTEISR